MNQDERVAEILVTFYESGADADPEELIRAHPDLADELRAQLDAVHAVDAALAPSLPQGTPARIGDYRILREIGRGGMGVVYEAEQESLDRHVALKLLSLTITGSEQAVRRFKREAKSAARIHHTNIVPIYAMGQHAGHWYYAMELVEGRSLDEVIRDLRDGARPATASRLARRARGSTTVDATWAGTTTGQAAYYTRIAELFAGVAEALHAAHAERVVHRDIKPSNLLLDADGVLKIVDFGLARVDTGGASMTVTGDLLGTPAYMSPEQAMAKRARLDHRTDIYSLGATMYEALTLRPPFRAKDLPGLCTQILSKDPPAMRRFDPKVPRDLETIVLKAMEKDRDKRYPNAGAFARDLRRFAEGLTVQARRIGPVARALRRVKRRKVRWSLATTAVLAAAVGLFFFLRASEEGVRADAAEYDRLLMLAQLSIAKTSDRMIVSTEYRDLVDKAIALMPDRPEGYLMRASADGVSVEDRIADIDRAREHGLPRRTYHRQRAALFASVHRWDDVAREKTGLEACDAAGEPVSMLDRYYEAVLRENEGDTAAAEAIHTGIIEAPGVDRLFKIRARRRRAWLRVDREDHSGALEDLMALRALAGDSPVLAVQIALAWKGLGKPGRAEQAFRGVLSLLEERSDTRNWSAACQAAMPHTPWLGRLTERGLERFPGSSDLLRCRGVYLAACSDWAGAIDHYRRSIDLAQAERDPSGVQNLALTWSNLGNALRENGEFRPALEAFDASIRLDAGFALAYAGRAGALLDLEDAEAALAAAEAAIALDPQLRRAHVLKAKALVELDRPDEADDVVRRLLDGNPADPELHYAVSKIYSSFGRDEAALDAARSAIELNPQSARYHEQEGHVLVDLRRYKQAVEAYDRALAIFPNLVAALHGKAEVLGRHLGRPEEALELYERVLDVEPENTTALNNLSLVLLQELDRPEEALEVLERLTKLLPDATTHTNRAMVLYRLKRWDEAAEAFDEALRLEPDSPSALITYGGMLSNLGQLQEGLDLLNRARELSPGTATLHFNRGVTLSRMGRDEKALTAFEEGCNVEPEQPWDWKSWVEAHVERAQLLAKLGRLGEARRAARRSAEAVLTLADSVGRFPARSAPAVAACRQATRIRDGRFWIARALVRYRLKEYDQVAYSVERGLEYQLPERSRWQALGSLLMAMAEAKLGNAAEARKHFEAAKDAPEDETLERFRAEAEQVLGTRSKQ